jgi:hypothetical protein
MSFEKMEMRDEIVELAAENWCANATNTSYEEEDQEVLSELRGSLARLVGTPYFEPLLSIS